MTRRAARVDTNHAAIVGALRLLGCTVQSLAAVGGGCPDIVVGLEGINFLLEIKDGDRAASKKKLTPDQVAWHGRWRGHVAIVETVDQALAVVGITCGETSATSGDSDLASAGVGTSDPLSFIRRPASGASGTATCTRGSRGSRVSRPRR